VKEVVGPKGLSGIMFSAKLSNITKREGARRLTTLSARWCNTEFAGAFSRLLLDFFHHLL